MQVSPNTEHVAQSQPLCVRLCDFCGNTRLPVRLAVRLSDKTRALTFVRMRGVRLPLRLPLRLRSRARCETTRRRATRKTHCLWWPQ